MMIKYQKNKDIISLAGIKKKKKLKNDLKLNPHVGSDFYHWLFVLIALIFICKLMKRHRQWQPIATCVSQS